MSQTTFDHIAQTDGDLNIAFIAHTGLSNDALKQIHVAMQASGLGFTEAALHLGLLTQEEIEKAVYLTLNSIQARNPSIVETALRKISSERQVVLWRGAEVVPGERLMPVLSPGHPRGEQIRALRTQLLLLSEGSRAATVIAVVSPSAGEGRSQLAAELALSFAQLGKQTLLVDADMRSPTQQLLFGCNEEAGLADAIAHGTAAHLHPVRDLPNMQFLAAGAIAHRNPLELLSDNRFVQIVDDWRRKNTFVVIDTPPVSQYSDAIAVATVAGRVLLLSRAKHTTYKDVREMMRRLAITRAHMLGAVVNHF